ncbi:MAG: EI24 domain-containing protein [bacterium]|nr:EI24 domain-containing protein [Candidatus Sumerlaeota bacterium]
MISLSAIPKRMAVPGFMSGVFSPFRAVLFIAAHPSLWPWCVAPLLINIAVVLLVWHWTGALAEEWLRNVPRDAGWWHATLRYGALIVAALLRLVLALASLVIIGNVASVPFNDFLSERTDYLLGWRTGAPSGWRRRIALLLYALLQELKRMALYIVVMASLFMMSFIAPLAPITIAAQFIVSAAFFALDYTSYSLERRGVIALGGKLRFALGRWPPCLGFGAVMTVMALVPVVNFLFIPVGVAAGTMLMRRLEESGSLRGLR